MDNHKKMKNNPFKYGGVVTDPYFIDREQEIPELTISLTGGANLILYSPRRFGKTSLMKKVAENLENQGIQVLYFDLFQVNSREQFLALYYQAILKKSTRWEKSLKMISALASSVRPVIKVEPDGSPVVSLEIDRHNQQQSFSEIVGLPEKMAGKKRWVVIFDEFQEVENFGGEVFEKELRSVIQHHQKVNYVLMGSKKHMLLGMVTRKNRAFYNFGKLVHLNKIPTEKWVHYIRNGFDSLQLPYPDDLILKVIETAENIPYYVQYLAFEIVECALFSHLLDESTMQMALTRVRNNQEDYFLTLWESLSLTQQKTLGALAYDNKNIFSRDFLDKHRIQTASGVQRSIAVLMRKGLIDKQQGLFVFEDPFFSHWILGRGAGKQASW